MNEKVQIPVKEFSEVVFVVICKFALLLDMTPMDVAKSYTDLNNLTEVAKITTKIKEFLEKKCQVSIELI